MLRRFSSKEARYWSRNLCASWAAAGTLAASAAQGQIFVANYGNGTVGEYSLTGTPINPTLIKNLAKPDGLATSGNDLFVSQYDGTVAEYTTSGTLVNLALITGLSGPSGLAISGNDLFVANLIGPNGNSASGFIGEYTLTGSPINRALDSDCG